jgi:hypothetical protein
MPEVFSCSATWCCVFLPDVPLGVVPIVRARIINPIKQNKIPMSNNNLWLKIEISA